MIPNEGTREAAPLHTRSPAELKQVLETERLGEPFLIYRDDENAQQVLRLSEEQRRITIGRRPTNDIAIETDTEMSRAHAEFECIGGEWTVVDDGLSRNGTFVNGVRLNGRQRLVDGDAVRCGQTLVSFRDPSARASMVTATAGVLPSVLDVTAAQRRVLIALCRPFASGERLPTPATNQEIAGELFLSVEAIKTHLRALFHKFEVEDLPPNQKRTRLVERALQSGLITERDLRD